ncbi:hypothetical protein JTB14_015168 [Gonioctena quinquepunctata]|nr:hypothetical protein JTB14_015168 [Gonioctena quinquepunctata]
MRVVAETVSNLNKNDYVDEVQQEVLPETPPRPSKISKEPQPSTSKVRKEVSSRTLYSSPEMVLPYHKVTKKPQQTSKKQNTGETVVSISTPYKTELKNSLERKRSIEIIKRPNIKRKIGKTKNENKAVSKIEKNVDSSAFEGDSNPECFYCETSFSESKKVEEVQHVSCKRWLHDA